MVTKIVLFLACAVSLFAAIDEQQIIKFEKDRFKNSSKMELKKVDLYFKKEIKEQWYAFILDVDAVFQGKPVNFKDVLFSNGSLISPELIDMKSGKSFKDELFVTLDDRYYKKSHLLIGETFAKDKIVVFADPLCMKCETYIPKLFEYVKKHQDTIALYYYHYFALQVNQASSILAKLSYIAKQKGVKDVIFRTYSIDWDSHFVKEEKSVEKILTAFNQEFGVDITLEELKDDAIISEIQEDIALGDYALIKDTPTVFINGEYDSNKNRYLNLGK